MKAVVTRVREASVEIAGEVHGAIDQGFLVLLGVGPEDDEETCDRLAEKVAHVRVFSDEAGKMNLSIDQVGGAFLVISQFTLYADLKKRPRLLACGQAGARRAALRALHGGLAREGLPRGAR